MGLTRQIITRISKVITRKDKSNNDYLILEVDSDSDIFLKKKRSYELWMHSSNSNIIISDFRNSSNVFEL